MSDVASPHEDQTSNDVINVELKWKCRLYCYLSYTLLLFFLLIFADIVRAPDFLSGMLLAAAIVFYAIGGNYWFKYYRRTKDFLWF